MKCCVFCPSHSPRSPSEFRFLIHADGGNTGLCDSVSEPLRSSPLALRQELAYAHSCRSGRGEMGEDRLDLPQGTLDLLILKALGLQPLHGWAVSERLQQ